MKYLFVLLCLLTAFVAHAQSNYRSGYIITNSNDTIMGFIDYRTDQMNALACRFKVNETDKAQVFSPGEIAGFRFVEDGKFYVSRTITLNGVKKVVFLEYLVQGMMNLYFYADESINLGYYFFEDSQGTITPVTKKPDEIVLIDGERYNQADVRYKSMVKYVFRDYGALQQEAEHMAFSHKDMIAITKDYHHQVCTTGAECVVFEATPDKQYVKFKFSIYGGVQVYMYENGGNSRTGPLIGAQANISVPRWQKAISFQMDLSLSNVNGNLLLGPKYTYPNGLIRPTIEGGVALWVNGVGSQPTFHCGFYAAVGCNWQLKKEHALFCSIGYIGEYNFASSARIPQLKVGYIF